MTEKAISPLRQRMIDDMTIRGIGQKTKDDYIRAVKNFTRFFGASPDRARFEDLRRYQLHMRNQGIGASTINSTVSALRFLFKVRCGELRLWISFAMSGPPGNCRWC